MVFLLPASPVHAASPTVTLSTISSGALTAATSGTVGSVIVVTGSGFNPASTITITTTVGTTTVSWLSAGGASTTAPAYDSLVVAGKLTTTASGNFQVEVLVPNLPGGAQTVTVSDGVNTGTATFTIKSAVIVTFAAANFGFPEEGVTPSIVVTGFGSGESVSVSTPMFTTATFTCATGSSLGTFGTSPNCGAGTIVADQTGGSKTITATGLTSGLTATATFTVNPWVAFYNAVTGAAADKTTFSFIGTAPTSIIIEAHGLPAAAIPANSITVGGVTANHASVTPGTTGTVYGLVASPSANVPFGLDSVVIAGQTFNYASGNIALGSITTGVVVTPNTNAPWGGALISSIIGSATTTGVASTDASAYKPGSTTVSLTSPAPQTSQIGFFGYGFVPAAAGGVLSIASPSAGAGYSTAVAYSAGNGGVGGANGAGKPDANGAFFATAVLGDTPWSSAVTPTTASSYAATVTQAGTAPANILSPSFGVTVWTSAPTVASVDFATATSVTGHGFSAGETLTLKVGGTATTGGAATCTAANGFCTLTGTVADIAGGSQSVTVTGGSSGQTAISGTVTVNAIVSKNGAQAILPNTGSAGTTAVLRTGSTYGVHGLLANTAYNLVWNSISGSTIVGTFTSTATGGIPVPGVQFTVPSDSSGIHILDIQTAAGASALFGSAVLGDVVPSIAGYSTAYGDMLFSNTATLQTTPSVASIGSPEGLSGNGLAAGSQYIVYLSSTGLCPVASQVAQPALGSFTSTGAGAVPSGTSLTLTDTPTTTETGTVENFVVQTAATYGVVGGSIAACGQFVLAASAADNATSEPAGHAVTLTAHGLNGGGAVYDVVFNYALNALGNGYTGETVGVVAPSSTGAATVTWNVPAGTAPNTYAVQLVLSSVGTSTLKAGTAVLNVPLTMTVGSVSITSCNTTSCMAVNGQPTQTTQGAYNGVSSQFTNNSNAPVTGFVYAVVHNALGQTVDISTATITAPAGGTVSAFNALFGLAPGTYSVTLFVTSSAGTAISGTSTVSVTIP